MAEGERASTPPLGLQGFGLGLGQLVTPPRRKDVAEDTPSPLGQRSAPPGLWPGQEEKKYAVPEYPEYDSDFTASPQPRQPRPRRTDRVDMLLQEQVRPGTPSEPSTRPSTGATQATPSPRFGSPEGYPRRRSAGQGSPAMFYGPGKAPPLPLGAADFFRDHFAARAGLVPLDENSAEYPWPGCELPARGLAEIGFEPSADFALDMGVRPDLFRMRGARDHDYGAFTLDDCQGDSFQPYWSPARPVTAPPDILRESPQMPDPRDLAGLKGRIVEFCKSQVGSRYLQRQLRKAEPEFVNLVVRELLPSLPELMCDTYGNYLCQQLAQAAGHELRQQMLERLAPSIFRVASDRKGTHALQALLGAVAFPEEAQFLAKALEPLVESLAIDQHGTHVVQRVLISLNLPAAEFIYVRVLANFVSLAQHPHGLCVVKKCILQADAAQRAKLLPKLAENAIHLVQCPFGNYAVQAALETWPGECTELIMRFKGRMLQLACQKFSSNVVEKCMVSADAALRSELIDELTGADRIAVLMESMYGMYAVQTACGYAAPAQLEAIRAGIQRNKRNLSNRQMRAKWDRILAQMGKPKGKRDFP